MKLARIQLLFKHFLFSYFHSDSSLSLHFASSEPSYDAAVGHGPLLAHCTICLSTCIQQSGVFGKHTTFSGLFAFQERIVLDEPLVMVTFQLV